MNTKAITFIDIFKHKSNEESVVKSIEIPIIQRDYAQGRDTKEIKRIRERFIDNLYNALLGKSAPVKLDFVYGNITDGKLIPLDGQQRLTTLYLLHWYIAKHENIEEEEYSFLNNFTYKTRFSSQHFCESLVQSTPDFSFVKLSDWIADQNWFMFSWEKDPTIISMLVMLDEIHSVFNETSGVWSKLYQPLVSFYFLALEDMGLTDNLYIKMNSRGKPLTEFEHFKAEFEKIVKDISKDLYEEFIHKVDIDWVDMLWNYRGNDDVIDDEFMKYFRYVTEMLCYRQEVPIVENDFDLANAIYGKLNGSASDNLKFLFKSYDCWKELDNINDFFIDTFSKHEYESNKVKIYTEGLNLFKQCCDEYGLITGNRRQFTLNNTLLLYGVLQFVLNKETISEVDFKERIRIVRNLVFNSSDEIRESRLNALLKDVEDLMLKGEINLNTLGFNEIQKKEEIEKISWRIQNNNLIDDLNRLEDHFLLQGSIAIIGLEEVAKFKTRVVNFSNLFNNEINYLTISKALLTIDDYSQLASWRFLFGNENNSTWRELFTISKQRKFFENTKDTILKLLDAIEPDYNDYLMREIEVYLNNPNTNKDWRFYFIKYPAMRKGNSGVYWWQNDPTREKQNQYEIIMMNTSITLNGKHWNPFLYTIYSDEKYKNLLTLEEYGDPLLINNLNYKVYCKNDSWEILDRNNELIEQIFIPQVNGFDLVDRIENFKLKIDNILNQK